VLAQTTTIERALASFHPVRFCNCAPPRDSHWFRQPVLFLPRIFLGTASGQFLRPRSRIRDAQNALRGFCFPGSSRTTQVPPIKHPLALGAAASRFW